MNGNTTHDTSASACTMGYGDEFQRMLARRNAAICAAHLLPRSNSTNGGNCSKNGAICPARSPPSPGARRRGENRNGPGYRGRRLLCRDGRNTFTHGVHACA